MGRVIDVTYHYRLHAELYRSPHLVYRGERFREPVTGPNPIVDVDALIEGMDSAGIDKTGIVATVAALDFGRGGRGPLLAENNVDEVHALISRHPERLFGWVGVHPFGRMDMLRYIEHAVRDLGFKGVHIFPHWFALPVNDRQYYPIYAKCAELGIPVALQIGIGGSPSASKVVATPQNLDDVLYDFPELQVLGLHLGNPWQLDFIALARNYLNFGLVADLPPATWHPAFLDALRSPRSLFGHEVDSWKADNELANRSLWGTNGAPGNERGQNGMGQQKALAAARDLDIRPDVLDAFLGDNAARILKV